MKISVATLVIVIFLSAAFLETANAGYATPQPSAQPPAAAGICNKKCGVRCAAKGPNSRCMKYCMMCCGKCSCVPSGSYGNLDECPCYRDWKAPNGRPKCP